MKFKGLISLLLAAVLFTGLLPAGVSAADDGLYSLTGDSVKVTVSGKNGGFHIQTLEGDYLIKSDNNKNLLYHRDAYDTSFTTFRVTNQAGEVKDYLFGGDYGFLGLSSSAVQTTPDATGITSVWSVDGLTFTQRIELANDGTMEHGAVLISYQAASASGEPVSVEARVLLDTALGAQDYACYEVVDRYGQYRSIERETLLTAADSIPDHFFGYDNAQSPEITAYTINATSPYQVAFGHWNNLAASLFDFAPNDALTFSNPYNAEYLTADSAVGMYYDLAQVSAAQDSGFSLYYGVYSNKTVSAEESVSVNLSAPTELTLSNDKQTYLPEEEGMAPGVFGVQAMFNNFVSDTAREYENVTVAAYASNGIVPLNRDGTPSSQTYLEPYTVQYADFKVGQTQTDTFLFQAAVGEASEFRKVELRVFDTSGSNGLMTADNMLGSRSFYVLCPGGDGKLPEIVFTSMKPAIVYNEGQRNLFITGRNFSMLINTSAYTLNAYRKSADGSAAGGAPYTIPDSQIAFSQEEGVDMMTVTLTDKMPTGTYELVFEWSEASTPPGGADRRMTAPALTFTVSDDKQYKNDYYGILAITRPIGDPSYYIDLFKTEEDFQARNDKEPLLLFKGSFEKTTVNDNEVYKATSVKTGGKSDNVVVINDCIDFENGTVTVKQEGGAILVDFDGDLYTSVKRSKIWSGKASFSEIRQGTPYSLVPYNGDGERMEGDIGEQVTLLWPCGLSIAQTISGMAFNMTFGALGIMYDVNESKLPQDPEEIKDMPVAGRVISFSASLDLSFLIPNAGKSKRDINWESIAYAFGEELTSTELRDRWKGVDMVNRTYNGLHYKDNRTKEGQASVMVQDILYGCGEGLMGVNFNVDLVLPGFFEAMPSVIGHLEVNTIGGFALGVDGKCQFATLEIETSIKVKDHDGIPIPDKLYFAIYGFEPGINVDGFGVLWITGGGGGIDNLYDTIFGGSSVPPLKILLSVSFDILKTLSAKVDLSLSLRGLSLTARDVVVKYANIPVLNKMQLAFEWYPEFYFLASVDAEILGAIVGQGYIVIMNSGQVEFFIRAGVKIPDMIPLLGGMQIAGADLGANNDKIWGVVRALGAELGVTYYWGGNISFGTGSAVSQPSFPSLLGYEDIPVYYDEETGDTLYMRAGSNLALAALAQVEGDAVEPVLLSADHTLKSDKDKKEHSLTLGAFNQAKAALVINYPAASEADAREKLRQITIGDKRLVLYEYDEASGTGNEDQANTNLVYNRDTQTATLNIVFSDPAEFGKQYGIQTHVAADLSLYDINPMPALAITSATEAGDEITINWTGSRLDELDSVNFMLTTDAGGDVDAEMYPLGSLTDSDALTSGSFTCPLPGDLPSGNYYVKAVYSKQDFIHEQTMSPQAVSYTNRFQPEAPRSVAAANGGDYMFDLTVDMAGQDDFDGYMVNIYQPDADGAGGYALTDISGLVFEKDADGALPKLEAGGYFKRPVLKEDGEPELDKAGNEVTELVGLAPGKAYRIGVAAFRNRMDEEGNVIARVLSEEAFVDTPSLAAPTPPTVTIHNITPYQTLFRHQEGLPEPVKTDTFADNSVAFTVQSDDQTASGAWTLNDTLSGTFRAGDTLTFDNLEDGDYKLTLTGEDADGDGFITAKQFAVDTMPPVLLLTSPINGGFFNEDGRIPVTGITDADALLTIYVDGVLYAERQTVEELGGDESIDSGGVFSFTLPGDATVSAQTVVISAQDKMNNTSEATTATVYNKGLAQAESLTVYADGKTYEDGNIPLGAEGLSARLRLGVNTPGGTFLLEENELVDWSVHAVKGSAAVDEDGILTVGAGSMGTVSARFYVADVQGEAAQEGYVSTMNASIAFGAESNKLEEGTYTLSLSAAIGGSVTGAGVYRAGEQITITAAAKSGYQFKGWTVKRGNVTLDAPASPTLTITMPAEDVELEAAFAAVTAPGGNGGIRRGGSVVIRDAGTINGKAGGYYSFNLPQNADGSKYAPFYYENGKKQYVRMSAEIDGKLCFVAPRDAVYYLEENTVVFDDISGHWAEPNILYSAARNIFMGVSETSFAPDENMTRAMFVTVLGRLSGITEETNKTSSFTDVLGGQWYTPYVAWASELGIVNGYGNDLFGPEDLVTREQMCAIISRYIEAGGFQLIVKAEEISFVDSGLISGWAKDSVTFCQVRELIFGKDNNRFAPLDYSTRAEVSTLMQRLIGKILETKK